MTANYIGKGDERINVSHRKEDKYSGGYIAAAIDDTGCHECVDLKLYRTNNRCYCCVWTYKPGHYVGGSGWAGGYGYHKSSAAAGEAIKNAGWQLSDSINGVGDNAIERAIRAIAENIYPNATQIAIVNAHG